MDPPRPPPVVWSAVAIYVDAGTDSIPTGSAPPRPPPVVWSANACDVDIGKDNVATGSAPTPACGVEGRLEREARFIPQHALFHSMLKKIQNA